MKHLIVCLRQLSWLHDPQTWEGSLKMTEILLTRSLMHQQKHNKLIKRVCAFLILKTMPRENVLYHPRQTLLYRYTRGSQGERQGVLTPSEKSQKIGFLVNTGLDSLKLTKLSSQYSMFGHHRPASETQFHWQADDGPLILPPLIN